MAIAAFVYRGGFQAQGHARTDVRAIGRTPVGWRWAQRSPTGIGTNVSGFVASLLRLRASTQPARCLKLAGTVQPQKKSVSSHVGWVEPRSGEAQHHTEPGQVSCRSSHLDECVA